MENKMKIVFFGPKGAGKTTVGKAFAEYSGFSCFDTDTLIEDKAFEMYGNRRTCREIFKQEGEAVFRDLERAVAQDSSKLDWCIVVTGGGLMLDPNSRRIMRENAILVYLTANQDVLWARATEKGLPPWLEGEDGPEKFAEQVAFRDDVVRPFADVVLDTTRGVPEELALRVADAVGRELAVRGRAANTYGDIIRISSFGESHGPALGIVLDGVKPGLDFPEEEIRHQMARRAPGQSKVVTQRKEPDDIQILSGVFEGKTTGAPIAMVIFNKDQRSRNYDNIKDVFRPGHGDFTFYAKYGTRDYRGGGRQSARETAGRVAAGAFALEELKKRGVKIVGHAVEIAGIQAKNIDFDTIENNPVRCADPEAAKAMERAILDIRGEKDSVGGIIQLEIHGLPPGIGDPIFGKLDARIISAIMTIGAIKGVEVGDGFALAKMRGSEANDAMEEGKFLSNHTGGILGGISNGEPVIMRVVVKPTASIAKKQKTMNEADNDVEIEVLGRHDPCIVPRAVPVIENMAALVVLDAWEVQARLNAEWAEKYGVW